MTTQAEIASMVADVRVGKVQDWDELADTLEQQAKRIVEIEQAAQAVVDRWDTPLWKDAPVRSMSVLGLSKFAVQEPKP